MRSVFLYILLLITLPPLAAQEIQMTSELRKAFELTSQLRITEAEELVRKEEKSNPDNLAVAYLKGAILTIELFIQEDADIFSDQKDLMEQYISRLEDAPDKDPQKHFMISQLRLGLAILHGRFRNNFSAGWQFYKAYNLLVDGHESFPDYYPSQVPLGVLYAAIGSLPDGYQTIASFIGIEGGVEEGMKMIRNGYWNAISEPKHQFYRDYFGFIYSYTSLTLLGNTDVSPESLSIDFRKSAYLTYMQALVEVEKGNGRRALDLLKEIPEGPQYYKFHYLDYYTGKIAIAFSADTSRQYLEKFLSANKSGNYVKSAYRYLSWCAMLEGDKDEFNRMRKLVQQEGSNSTGADKQALREVNQPFNEVLTRGRILFDGGRYREALNYLYSKSAEAAKFTTTDKVEYHYRLGRILQERQEFTAALEEFTKALNLNPAEHTFALGNSALQAARIHEELKNKQEALKYYRLTLGYKDYPYYEGNHQQAKSGIDRLE